jgi:hypothetical protein
MVANPKNAKRLASTFQHTVLFWLLMIAAGAMFLPCVLLPTYGDYCSWRDHRAAMAARIEALEDLAEQNERIIDALRTDPGVNERVLARDLGYVRPDEEIVEVLPAARHRRPQVPQAVLTASVSEATRMPAPVQLRPWEARIEQRLPRGHWLTAFTEGPSRRVLLILSGAMTATALACFPPRRPAA